MNIRKILCLVLALVLCGAMAFAESDLDAANARIAELEAQVELYKPFYEAQVVAEFDGGIVLLDDVMEEYEYTAQMYAQYGIDLVQYGMDAQIKQDIITAQVRDAVAGLKASEMGLDQLDDETLAGLTEEAAANFELYIESISEQMLASGYAEDTVRDEAIAYLNQNGYSEEIMLDDMLASYISDALYDEVTKDVTVSDDEIKAAYDEMVAQDETNYASDSTYNNARNGGETILWNPEGYRAVKHVLVKFTDEQTTRYNEISGRIDDFTAELEAEQTEESRAKEEIEADLAAAQAELDALYEELMPKANEVVDKFNDGAAFADLIAEYNEDPGMTNEPTASLGYAVAATSTAWDPAFTEGSMSIESVGGISEPVRGMYGIHIIYYESDIPAGAVAFEEVKDYVAEQALLTKTNETYTTAVDEWVDAAAPTYHFDRL